MYKYDSSTQLFYSPLDFRNSNSLPYLFAIGRLQIRTKKAMIQDNDKKKSSNILKIIVCGSSSRYGIMTSYNKINTKKKNW